MSIRQAITDKGFHFPVNDAFRLAVSRGEIPGLSYVHKFGANASVSTTLVPVCQGGNYRTPTAAVTLTVVSDDANDTAGGTGARKVQLNYLDIDGVEHLSSIATNGASESSESVSGVWRLLRVKATESGTYATSSGASQKGTISIQVAGGGDVWAVIPEIVTGFGSSQSLIGAYTVPRGKTAYILSVILTVDSNKSASFYFFARAQANVTSAPYYPMQIKNLYKGLSGATQLDHTTFEAYSEFTDIGFMAVAPTTADCGAEFELLLVDN